MRTQKRSKLLAPIAIFMALLMWSPASVYALGLSPPTVEIESLLRGTTQTRNVTLYRAPDDIGDVYIRVEPDTLVADFFVLEDQDIVILNGQNEISYTFGITSGDAANGAYELKLRFLKTSDPSRVTSGAGVAVITGITAQILVTVGGEENLEFAFTSVYAQETEEGLDVPIFYSVDNTGNVDWRPSKILFEFFDEAGVLVGSRELSGGEIEVVKAGQTGQKFEVRVPAVLVRGRYTVSASFWDQENSVGALTSAQSFNVYAPGTLAQSGTLAGLSVNKPVFYPGEQAKVSGIFQNDGQTDITANLVLEVSKDGEIIDMLRGEELEVRRGEEFVFSKLFKVSGVGLYDVSGHVEYGNRQTATKQVSFEVQEEAVKSIPGARFFNSTIGLVLLAVVLIVATWLFAFVLKRRRHVSAVTLPPSAPPILPAPLQGSDVSVSSAVVPQSDSADETIDRAMDIMHTPD